MRRKYRGSKQPGYHSGVKRDRRIRMRLPFAEIMVNRFSPIFGPEKKERLSSLSLSSTQQQGKRSSDSINSPVIPGEIH